MPKSLGALNSRSLKKYGALLALGGLVSMPLAMQSTNSPHQGIKNTIRTRQLTPELTSLRLSAVQTQHHPIMTAPETLAATTPPVALPGAAVPVAAASNARVPEPPQAPQGTTPGSSSSTSTTAPGIFLQVSSLSPTYSVADVQNWMAQVCSTGTSAAGPTLVLQDIDTASGQLNTPYLNVIVPYLPGYSNCFSKVYIGTTGISYSGPGTLYQQGVQNTALRANYQAQSQTLATQFLATYPKVIPNWYITLEANLNELDQLSVTQAYATILTNQIQTLSHLAPQASFLWSPGFWYTYTGYSSNSYGMGLLGQGLATIFQQIKSTTQNKFTLDLQDEVGTTNCWGSGAMTPQDAADWAQYLESITAHPTIEVNTSLFETACSSGGTLPLSLNQTNQTESYYVSKNVPLGPAYELRYWLVEHGDSLTTPS